MGVEVGTTADVPEGEARQFMVKGAPVAVANLGGGGFAAVGDLCSHAQAFLSEGEVDVEDETIECPRHGSTFDLRTGQPKTLPATAPVPAFDVTIEGVAIIIETEE